MDDVFVISTVDTKDRICLVQFHKKGPHIPFYLQVIVPRRAALMRSVLNKLKEWECNVIKLQVRDGMSVNLRSTRQYENCENYCRMDLTFVTDIFPQREHIHIGA